MRDIQEEKWVRGVSSSEPIHEAAVGALQSRLNAVLYYLPLAAEEADKDEEYVHQLRVWARRATAAMQLYGDLLSQRRQRWIKKQLKRVRRAANDARDCDVLLRRLKEDRPSRALKRWKKEVLAERSKAQEAILSIHKRLKHNNRFIRKINKLLEQTLARGERKSTPIVYFGPWSHERLRPMIEQFFDAFPSALTDEAALHKVRILGKQLRYHMELVAGAFPDELQTKLYPVIEAIQDRLGEINDIATAKLRLRQKIKAASDSKRDSWRRLLTNEQVKCKEAHQKFWAWCTPQMLLELRSRFDAMFDTPARLENGTAVNREVREKHIEATLKGRTEANYL